MVACNFYLSTLGRSKKNASSSSSSTRILILIFARLLTSLAFLLMRVLPVERQIRQKNNASAAGVGGEQYQSLR